MATCQVLYFRLPPSTGNVIPAIPAIQKTPNVNIKSDNERIKFDARELLKMM